MEMISLLIWPVWKLYANFPLKIRGGENRKEKSIHIGNIGLWLDCCVIGKNGLHSFVIAYNKQ